MHVFVPPDSYRQTTETARTLMSVSFTKIAGLARRTLNASIASALIDATAKLASKMRQATIENAWTWTSAKNILACVNIAV